MKFDNHEYILPELLFVILYSEFLYSLVRKLANLVNLVVPRKLSAKLCLITMIILISISRRRIYSLRKFSSCDSIT